jgi:hypothetical protein
VLRERWTLDTLLWNVPKNEKTHRGVYLGGFELVPVLSRLSAYLVRASTSRPLRHRLPAACLSQSGLCHGENTAPAASFASGLAHPGRFQGGMAQCPPTTARNTRPSSVWASSSA